MSGMIGPDLGAAGPVHTVQVAIISGYVDKIFSVVTAGKELYAAIQSI